MVSGVTIDVVLHTASVITAVKHRSIAFIWSKLRRSLRQIARVSHVFNDLTPKSAKHQNNNNNKNPNLQTHGIAMGTKMAVAFTVIFMAHIEKQLLASSPHKPIIWKRFIDDIFSVWTINENEINDFVLFANSFHPTIKFTCEMSSERIVFLDTEVFKGPRFAEGKILDVETHFKPTETFKYTHFSSCHSFSVKKSFIKGETLRLLRTNSAETKFESLKRDFESRLLHRG